MFVFPVVRYDLSVKFISFKFREVHTHQVQLSQEENAVYQKLLAFSRKALEEYIKNQENKIKEGYGFTYDRSVIFKMHCYSFDYFMKLVLFSLLLESPRTSSEERDETDDVGAPLAPQAGLLAPRIDSNNAGCH